MHRSLRRRLIVLITLLSHLMAALLVHVPMAYASTPASVEAATASPPCPDHMADRMAMDHMAMDDHSPQPSADTATSDHSSGCKSGPCKCPCAHAQALALVSLGIPLVAHTPSHGRYRVLLAPDCETAFFRPPIV